MGGQHRTRSSQVRHALVAANEGGADLSPYGQPARGPAASWNSKIESTVRYLGIEVDDAIEIAEKIDI
jgi:hypothetical protein